MSKMGAAPRCPPAPRPATYRLRFTQYIEAFMFIDHRPISAVLAALATSTVFVVLDLLLRYAAR